MAGNKNFKFAYALSLLTQIGVFVSIVAIVFVLGGKYLDERCNTPPLFLIAGLVLSACVNIYGIYKLLQPLMKDDDNKRE